MEKGDDIRHEDQFENVWFVQVQSTIESDNTGDEGPSTECSCT